MTINELIQNTINQNGGEDVTAALVICEWYPTMFSTIEFTSAKALLRLKKITPVFNDMAVDRLDMIRDRARSSKRVLPKNPGVSYTDTEKEYITENWLKLSNIEMGKVLSRTTRQVEYLAKSALSLPDKRFGKRRVEQPNL